MTTPQISAFRALLTLSVALALLSCTAESEAPQADFSLQAADGATRTVRRQRVDDAGALGLETELSLTVFDVDGGFSSSGNAEVLTLALWDAGGAQLGVIGDDGQGHLLRALPDEARGLTVVEATLPPDRRYNGFLIAHRDSRPEARVDSATLSAASAHFEYDGSALHLGAGIELEAFDWAARRSIRLAVAPAARKQLDSRSWAINLRFDPQPAAVATHPDNGEAYTAGRVHFSTSERSRSMRLVLTPGNVNLYFNSGIIGFVPSSIEVEVEPGMAVEHVTVQPDALVGTDTTYPAIPADLGVINFYDQRAWRHPRFELFAWNVANNVLVFDFADLDIQRDMFGRLGFFVAVAGEAGQIFPEEYYEGRHTYNAHDYRPQDLVSFFSTAEQTGVALNQREQFLRDVLIDYGIIHADGNRYTEGHGAVLSFSRATWRPLRQRLLRHEAMHGIFYVSERFREGSFELWDSMSALEQEYWRLFLGNKGRMDGREGYDGYDVDRHYLLVNEMQAHVLQLHPHEVNPYFRDFYARRIREVAPSSAHVVNNLIAAEPDVFVETRRALEELLEEVTGVSGGYLMAVYPEEVEILHR